MTRQAQTIWQRWVSAGIAVIFGAQTVLPSAAVAQATAPLWLPPPGVMLAPSDPFAPAVIRGLRVNPDNPLRFDFIIDTGHSVLLPSEQEIEYSKLIRYFLAALTVPEDELWVNLSPYESDRIIPEKFGLTEMGRDLLAQDYALKQLTASLFDPKKDLGAAFWKRARRLAYERFGVEDINVETFNKVWVLPEKAVVYERGDVAFIVESRLKVMLEADYFALDEMSRQRGPSASDAQARPNNALASQVIREVIVPEIEREVNEGEHFAPLRQAYHSLILAAWFKQNLKESVVGKVYVEQNKVKGVDLAQADAAQQIYRQYLEAFKVGVYDYIEDEYDPVAQTIIPRKYFSGGFSMAMLANPELLEVRKVGSAQLADAAMSSNRPLHAVTTDLTPAGVVSPSPAMLSRYGQNSGMPTSADNARITVPRPRNRRGINPKIKEEYIKSFPIWRQSVARAIFEKITHNRQDDFEQALRESVQQFRNSIANQPYYWVLPPIRLGEREIKSHQWVYSLAREMGLPKPEAVIAYNELGATQLNKISHFALFDDAAYSGKQLASYLKMISDQLRKNRQSDQDIQIHAVVPYMTTVAKERIDQVERIARRQDSNWGNIKTYKTRDIMIIKELFSDQPEILSRIIQIFGESSIEKTLTYFDHKIPDGVSILSLPDGNSRGELVTILDGLVFYGEQKLRRPFVDNLNDPPPYYEQSFIDWFKQSSTSDSAMLSDSYSFKEYVAREIRNIESKIESGDSNSALEYTYHLHRLLASWQPTGYENQVEDLLNALLREKLGLKDGDVAAFMGVASAVQAVPITLSGARLGYGVVASETPAAALQSALTARDAEDNVPSLGFWIPPENLPDLKFSEILSEAKARIGDRWGIDIQAEVEKILEEKTSGFLAYWVEDYQSKKYLIITDPDAFSGFQWIPLSEVLPQGVLEILPQRVEAPAPGAYTVSIYRPSFTAASPQISDHQTSDEGQEPGGSLQQQDRPLTSRNNVGGIDLNPARMDLETLGGGMNWNVPVDPAMLTPSSVEGFVPVIIQIGPANLPMLLGMVEDGDAAPQVLSAAGAISRL